ncbi:uncharacterized protein G2W53_026063 [Senna tora]|uniref:Uncharacterized protein n=1 Tax=Senna tora TaxID=362788 RepID=A0A834WH33_9FABA|nr:uncharacterized protein G2W53_026063 [Senna tora]
MFEQYLRSLNPNIGHKKIDTVIDKQFVVWFQKYTKPRSLVDDQHALEVAYQSERAYNVIPIDDGVLYVDLGDISQIAEEIEQVHEDENNPDEEDIEEDSDDGAEYDKDEDIESENEDNNEI